MRSAVLSNVRPEPYADSRPLTIEHLDRPDPRAGELRVRMILASLCHSDLSVVDGSRPRPLPMVLGHEGVGVVDAVGDGVFDVAVGDNVVMLFVPSCGRCTMCAAGRPALCVPAAAANNAGALLHGPGLLHDHEGVPIQHHLGVSAFSEYAVVARESVVVIPEHVPHEVGAILGCAVLTGMGAVFNTGALQVGQSVVVFGLGAVGLAAVMAAAAAGARYVIAVDPARVKHASAIRAGATTVVTPAELDGSLHTLGLEGVDLAIEAVGSARVIESAFGVLARGGLAVAVGLPDPEQTITLPALSFAGAGRRLVGSYMGDSVPVRDIPRYLALWEAGKLPLEVLHTDTQPMSAINEGLDALAAGLVVRRLFRPDQ